MARSVTTDIETFFRQRAQGRLRSVVEYEPDSFEVVYTRNDVAEQYTQAEIERAIDDSRMESLSAPVYDDIFATDHGELSCLVKCFENVIELNFIVADGRGTAVALDAEALDEAHGLVADAREIVMDEHQEQ